MDSQANQNQTKQDRSRTKWTTALDKIFAEVILEQVRQGKWLNNAFSKGSWKHICDDFNKQAGLEFNKNQLKKHLDVLRNKYYAVKSQLDQNGLGGNESRNPVMSLMTEDEVWDDYQFLEVYPGAGPAGAGEVTKVKDCPIYDQLCQIFSEPEPSGIGRFAQSSHYIDLDKETAGTETPQPQALNVAHPTSIQDDTAVKIEEEPKPKHVTPVSSRPRKRYHVFDDEIAEAMLEMAKASKLRANAMIQTEDQFSITKCVEILDQIPDLDEHFYLSIVDMFENPNLREIFISLKSDKRVIWLQSKYFPPGFMV